MALEDRPLTPKDVAREMGVSEAWVRDHASGRRQPTLPVVRLGGKKPIPHIPLPFKEVIADVLKVKPPEKTRRVTKARKPR